MIVKGYFIFFFDKAIHISKKFVSLQQTFRLTESRGIL